MDDKLILNVYKMERDEHGERIIEKTYTAETFDLMFGPVEDIVGAIDLDNLNDTAALGKLIITAMQQIKPIFKDVFWGITDEELKRTTTTEIVDNVMKILKMVVGETALDNAIKNVQTRG